MAGIRTPQNITEAARIEAGSDKPSLQKLMPEAFAAFVDICERLEKHYRDMQDLEFTIERGKLWMLQTRSGKRTAKAALKIAVDMAEEGLITREEAIARIDPASLDQLLHPTIDPEAARDVIGIGLPASPGAATGEIVFSSEDAEEMKAAGRKVILVRVETSPEDIHGMHAAEGILTTRGGMTSHAAVVARGMGKPCVSGAGSLRVDYRTGTLMAMGVTLQQGRRHHHRRRHRPGAEGRGADAAAGTVRRLRRAHGVGRREPPHEGAHQCRDAGRCPHGALVRRRRHRALPHRAHVLRGRPHRRHARDDPRRQRGGPARSARQAAADAALGFRRAVRDHGRPAGDHPPARSAAARVPAQDRGRDRRGRGRHEGVGRKAAPAHRGAARVQPDARPSRLPARRLLSGDRRDAGARHLRGGDRGRAQETGSAGGSRDHGAAGRPEEGARLRQGAHRRGGAKRHGRRPAPASTISSAR